MHAVLSLFWDLAGWRFNLRELSDCQDMLQEWRHTLVDKNHANLGTWQGEVGGPSSVYQCDPTKCANNIEFYTYAVHT